MSDIELHIDRVNKFHCSQEAWPEVEGEGKPGPVFDFFGRAAGKEIVKIAPPGEDGWHGTEKKPKVESDRLYGTETIHDGDSGEPDDGSAYDFGRAYWVQGPFRGSKEFVAILGGTSYFPVPVTDPPYFKLHWSAGAYYKVSIVNKTCRSGLVRVTTTATWTTKEAPPNMNNIGLRSPPENWRFAVPAASASKVESVSKVVEIRQTGTPIEIGVIHIHGGWIAIAADPNSPPSEKWDGQIKIELQIECAEGPGGSSIFVPSGPSVVPGEPDDENK